MLSTKWPSMMSRCIQSAPASSARRTSVASWEKSAARREGAISILGDVMAGEGRGETSNVQRPTSNVQLERRSVTQRLTKGVRALHLRDELGDASVIGRWTLDVE